MQKHYPFGMLQPERKFNAGGYRFGFNGKENDNEVKGLGNQQDYGFRIYDSRLGRFLSIDPLTKDYPFYSPYQFAGNKPIWAIDLEGLEEYYATDGSLIIKIGENTEMRVVNDRDIEKVRAYANWANYTSDDYYKDQATQMANNFSTPTGLNSGKEFSVPSAENPGGIAIKVGEDGNLRFETNFDRAVKENSKLLKQAESDEKVLGGEIKKAEEERGIRRTTLDAAGKGDPSLGRTAYDLYENMQIGKKRNRLDDLMKTKEKLTDVQKFLEARKKKADQKSKGNTTN